MPLAAGRLRPLIALEPLVLDPLVPDRLVLEVLEREPLAPELGLSALPPVVRAAGLRLPPESDRLAMPSLPQLQPGGVAAAREGHRKAACAERWRSPAGCIASRDPCGRNSRLCRQRNYPQRVKTK
jgi:hypothetical protein